VDRANIGAEHPCSYVASHQCCRGEAVESANCEDKPPSLAPPKHTCNSKDPPTCTYGCTLLFSCCAVLRTVLRGLYCPPPGEVY